MPRKWTRQEEKEKYEELFELYVRQKKNIFEIGPPLGIAGSSVYDRLVRLGIPRRPSSTNARIIYLPPPTGDLAEFCGVMLGDGHVGLSQIFITVNVKTDASYVLYCRI